MNGALVAAVGLSGLSAVAYALAAVTQERLAAAARPGPAPLFASPRWWAAIALNGAGALLHVFALAFGSLTVVQPLGALTLVVALPVGAAVAGHRVGGREWRGAAATVTGLVGVLLAANTGAPTEALADGELLAVLALTAAAIALLARPATAGGPGLRVAAAGGLAFAVSSVLTQTVLLRVGTDGAGALRDPVLAGALLGVIALSAGGLLLSQAAYRSGLGAPLATLTIVNPVTAAVVGIALLGQGAGLTLPAIGAALAAAMLAAAGVVRLATPGEPVRRPGCRVVRATADRRPGRHLRRLPRRRPSRPAGPSRPADRATAGPDLRR